MKIKKGGWWLVSAFVTVMIRYSVTGGISDPSVPDIASKIINSFSNNAVMDVLLLAGGVFPAYGKERRQFSNRCSNPCHINCFFGTICFGLVLPGTRRVLGAVL